MKIHTGYVWQSTAPQPIRYNPHIIEFMIEMSMHAKYLMPFNMYIIVWQQDCEAWDNSILFIILVFLIAVHGSCS